MPEPEKTRIVIENVYPAIDGGRFPVKRIIGEKFQVWCDIFMDGHDHLKAILLYSENGAQVAGSCI